MERRNFLAASALLLASALSPISRAEEPESPFKAPTLEDVLDKEKFVLESRGSGEGGVILIPFTHPQYNLISTRENTEVVQGMKENRDLAHKIQRNGLASDLILEGLTVEMADRYNKGKKVELFNLHNQKTEFYDAYSSWLNGCKWNLIGIPYQISERTALHTAKITAEEKLKEVQKGWQERGWLDSKEAFQLSSGMAFEQMNGVLDGYITEVTAYYEKDPKGKVLYDSVVTNHERKVIAAAREIMKTRKIVIGCGTGHEQGLRAQLEKEGIPYQVARNKRVGQYRVIPEEVLMEELRKQTLAFIEPIVIKIKGLDDINITPQLDKQPFYAKYISPGQK